jgi:5'-nucleotidase
LPYVPVEQRNTFKLEDQYPPECTPLIQQIIQEPGFFFSLPPIPGGLEAVAEMAGKHDVFICTAPMPGCPDSAGEKYCWVEKYLGGKWTRRTISTFDKTLVRGDYLIDDMVNIKGLKTPSWEQVIFSSPSNRMATGKRRIKKDWSNWRKVLPELL